MLREARTAADEARDARRSSSWQVRVPAATSQTPMILPLGSLGAWRQARLRIEAAWANSVRGGGNSGVGNGGVGSVSASASAVMLTFREMPGDTVHVMQYPLYPLTPS
jgi:hypothetical protein